MSAGLDTIERALTRLQTEGGVNNAAILDVDEERNYYVQLIGSAHASLLRAEATGSTLDDERRGRLGALGWERDKGNYVQDWEARTDAERRAVAGSIWQALREVYGFPEHAQIDVVLHLQ